MDRSFADVVARTLAPIRYGCYGHTRPWTVEARPTDSVSITPTQHKRALRNATMTERNLGKNPKSLKSIKADCTALLILSEVDSMHRWNPAVRGSREIILRENAVRFNPPRRRKPSARPCDLSTVLTHRSSQVNVSYGLCWTPVNMLSGM